MDLLILFLLCSMIQPMLKRSGSLPLPLQIADVIFACHNLRAGFREAKQAGPSRAKQGQAEESRLVAQNENRREWSGRGEGYCFQAGQGRGGKEGVYVYVCVCECECV
ncbi:MAG: hypothetical protein J3Q66DRAFT_359840 [Benniella sp.]|nr:MAG: hypothetical protein J3Q66DRAFT_359840 [Benniella sp.]